MSAAQQPPPHCPECGLFSPCETCGGGSRPKLSLVAASLTYSYEEVLAAMRKAFIAGVATSFLPDRDALSARIIEIEGSE